MKTFKELGLNDYIINCLNNNEITDPKEIQELAIEHILQGKDLIGMSHTGSGKTLAFVCPIVQSLDTTKRQTQALILAPTHELVMQTSAVVKMFASDEMPITSLAVIGDVNIEKQIKKIKETKPHIIIGTPGRVLDLIKKKKITAHTLNTIVIDEGDNLLDNTNTQAVKDIVKSAMRDTQLLIFSATMTGKALNNANSFMKVPVMVGAEGKATLNPNIKHMYIEVDNRDKAERVRKLISAVDPDKALVFVNKGMEVDLVTEKLNFHNIPALSIHKKISKEDRQKAMDSIRSGKIKVLVSSDVSARGLDIPDITHVINLDFPRDSGEYLHRAGRTARGNKGGCTISLVTEREKAAIRIYEREFKIEIVEKKLSHGKLQ
ncbi:MAG: DEAD/DEAH box helicase [Clostridium sp.]|uniref:DEAD/DEAH box helicase n=1 Tax=Clostridium sp. TaxID=1506 RepID=UPI002FCB7F2F